MQDGCGIAFLCMERNLDIMQLWKKLCTFLTAGMLALSVSPAAISAVPEICAAAAENTSTYGELKYTLTSDRAIITSCEKSAVSVTIPEEIEGKPVLQIAENAFYSRTELTDVTIPDTVRALGSRAFYGCSKLNHVQLPKYLLTMAAAVSCRVPACQRSRFRELSGISGTACFSKRPGWRSARRKIRWCRSTIL